MIEKINFKKTDWSQIQEAIDDYTWIMKNLQTTNDDFKRKFAHFYKVNLGIKNKDDKKYFFILLKDSLKINNDNYSDVLDKLSKKTGRNEMSFASKIVATVNPDLPVIDKIVLRHLLISRPSYSNLIYRKEKSVSIFKEIEAAYNEFLNTTKGKKLIHTFNSRIKQQRNFKITNIKKLDFILWQTRK